MDIVTYALLKKKLAAAVAGITNITINGTDIIFTLSDGSQLTMTVPTPADGKSITNVELNSQSHLICTLSDGSTIDAGEIHQGIDGKDGKDGKDGVDGQDGVSITNVEINDNRHLIVTLSSGTTIDAGEVGGAIGGMVQEPTKNDFPIPGSRNIIYLAEDTQIIYYWDGTSYQEILTNETQIQAELKTGKIIFNDVDDTFDLPVDDVQINVYVNGMYLTEGFDYIIDRSSNPNKITFDTIYEEEDICTITYLEKVSEGGDSYASNSEIDELFKEGGN